jgi:hypothetical protein
MALHRDIFWLGRQWAVTGHGIQACDQRQGGAFDIEVSQIWEDHVVESLRAKDWLNAEDFDKALAVARKRYPQPPRKPEVGESVSCSNDSDAVERPKFSVQKFDMHGEGLSAKLGPLWRIRARR